MNLVNKYVTNSKVGWETHQLWMLSEWHLSTSTPSGEFLSKTIWMEGHQAEAGSHGVDWTDIWSNSALLIVILKHIYKPDSWYLPSVVPNQVRSVQIQSRLCVWGAQGWQRLGPHWGVLQALSEMSAGCKVGSWHCVLAEAAVGLSAYTQLAYMIWCCTLGPCKLTLTSHRHDKG